MPAAAVIPALRAYIKVVAFKTPVVEISIPPRPPAPGGASVWRVAGGAGGLAGGDGGRVASEWEGECGGRRGW